MAVQNGTTLVLTVTVNGGVALQLAPGEERRSIEFSMLPARPWVVEARTASGRVLATMRVSASDGVPGPGGAMTQVRSETKLSCGTLLMYIGDSPPPGLPQENPSFEPGDCAP